jgi:hypothetical protein
MEPNDPYRHALAESAQPAAPDFVASLREKLDAIKEMFPHKESTVDSCLRGLEGRPTLGEILVAAYVLNGGMTLKFNLSKEAAHDAARDAEEFDSLLKEIECNIGAAALDEDEPAAEATEAGERLVLQ